MAMGAAAKQSASQALVVVSTVELTDIVERAVRSALELAPSNAVSEYMTLDECAEELRCAPRTVKNWIAQRGLPGYRVGPEYRFRRDEVAEWLRHQRIVSE